MTESDETTQDWIGGRLALHQSKQGYRFGLDALILATDLPQALDYKDRDTEITEFGAAQGAVILSIAARYPQPKILAIERQPSLVSLLERNLDHNATKGVIKSPERVTILPIDLRQIRSASASHRSHLVVCNPPYYPKGTRRLGENTQKNEAFHALHGDLEVFLQAAAFVLHPRGWMKLILPPWRLLDLTGALGGLDLRLVSIRPVYPKPQKPAYLMEVLLRRGLKQVEITWRPPLFIRDAEGEFTPEVQQRMSGAAGSLAPHRSVEV